MVPYWWSKPLKELRAATFNARVETVAEVCGALREIDAEQWEQLRANADALAKEWADARRRTNVARRRYANTLRRTSQSGGFDARMWAFFRPNPWMVSDFG